MTTNLKPCPFCGGRVEEREVIKFADMWTLIQCDECGARTGLYRTGGPARAAWNRRDGEAAARAEGAAEAALEREREIVAAIAGLPTFNDEEGRLLISWFAVQKILRGIEGGEP